MFLQSRNLLRLASHDYFREWKISTCFILALAAVLGPMMILFGLKFGIVNSLFDQLKDNPKALEIKTLSSGKYHQQWIESLRQLPAVKFISPLNQSISSNIQLQSESSAEIITVIIIPTAKNDPLLPQIKTPVSSQLVLSQKAADKLRVSAGDHVDASLARQKNGLRQRQHFSLEVIAIAPEQSAQDLTAFVTLPLADWVEDYRNGLNKAKTPIALTTPETNKNYPGFRLYTNTVYEIETISKQLVDAHIKIKTQAREIKLIKSMDKNISQVYWIVAAIGLIGFALSLGASLWANIDRKRRDLSILRLVGFSTSGIIWFPIIQSMYTAFLGWMFATYVYFGISYAINQRFSDRIAGEKICQLLPEHIMIALAITLLASILAALIAGWRAAGIEPSQSLREN